MVKNNDFKNSFDLQSDVDRPDQHRQHSVMKKRSKSAGSSLNEPQAAQYLDYVESFEEAPLKIDLNEQNRAKFKKRKWLLHLKLSDWSASKWITLSFVPVILLGALLLMLPIASRTGESVGFLNALFTSASATCVTGLIVGDTATMWTMFGQIVILGLIQIGGLGLITLTTFFVVAVHKKGHFKSRLAFQEMSGLSILANTGVLVRQIIITTLSCELLGGIVLSLRYAHYVPPAMAWQMGLFQGVSAFCNAGFDLIGLTGAPYTSLINYQNDPLIIGVTTFLIIVGGLGFVVWHDLFSLPKAKTLSYHSKLVLSMTVGLLLVGTLVFIGTEWNNVQSGALGTLSSKSKIGNAFFQAVTLRTAGFNAINQATLSPAGKLMSCLLMFIGAGPASTAGGIKLTTFAILLGTVNSYLRGRNQITLKKHRFSQALVTRTLAITFIAISTILIGTFLLCVFEQEGFSNRHLSVIDLLFEVASAFGTVGVSAVGTPSLTVASKCLLIFILFLGRVGPVSFAMGLTFKQERQSGIIYPEGKTFVG